MAGYRAAAGGYKHKAWLAECRQNTDEIVKALDTLMPHASGRAKDVLYEALGAAYRNQRLYSTMLEELDWRTGDDSN